LEDSQDEVSDARDLVRTELQELESGPSRAVEPRASMCFYVLKSPMGGISISIGTAVPAHAASETGLRLSPIPVEIHARLVFLTWLGPVRSWRI
jgi:hypothetical protein